MAEISASEFRKQLMQYHAKMSNRDYMEKRNSLIERIIQIRRGEGPVSTVDTKTGDVVLKASGKDEERATLIKEAVANLDLKMDDYYDYLRYSEKPRDWFHFRVYYGRYMEPPQPINVKEVRANQINYQKQQQEQITDNNLMEKLRDRVYTVFVPDEPPILIQGPPPDYQTAEAAATANEADPAQAGGGYRYSRTKKKRARKSKGPQKSRRKTRSRKRRNRKRKTRRKRY